VDDWPPRSSGDLGGPSVPRGQQPPRRQQPPRGTPPRRAAPPPGRAPVPRSSQAPRAAAPQSTRVAAAPNRERVAARDSYRGGRGGGGSGRRNVMRTVRTLLALVSVLVLGLTWYGWSTVTKLTSGLTTADVIDPAAKTVSGPQNILLVGIDTRTDAQGNPLPQDVLNQLHAGGSTDGGDTTDTMIVIHIPAGGGRAVAFSIPRDSYVEIADGNGKHKINSAYTYGSVAASKKLKAQGVTGADLAKQSAQAGARTAIDTIQQFTGLQINHFASVNLVGFYDISQAIGGVQVCLKAPVHDSKSGANFPAGVQSLQGAQALAFVRQRYGLPNSDLDRIKRQQVFMASMAHEVLSAGVLTDKTKLDSLISAIQKSITLDQGWDVLSFAQQLQGMSAGQIEFQTIPIVNITYLTQSDGDAVEVNPSQVQQFVQTQVANADNPPQSTTAPTTKAAAPPAAPNTAANAGITAQVYNSTGIKGLATDVLGVLTGQGFASGGIGNGSTRTTSVIDYASGDQAAAQKVATALGGNITLVSSKIVSAGTIRVYLGRDYSGPKGAGSTSTSTTKSTTTTTAGPPPITAGGSNCVN
jgi:LCP family protein required for cell wall assembly